MASNLRFFPVTIFFALPGTFIITYLVSALINNDTFVLPYVNETGSKIPGSCIFGMLLNLTAALLLFVVYIRHKQISEFFHAKNLNKSKKYISTVNMIATIIGVLVCIGLDIAANFQKGQLTIIHDSGILLCFWCSAIYIFMQTVISFWMSPEMTSLWVVAVRGILGMMAAVFTIVAVLEEINAEKQLFGDIKLFNNTIIDNWNSSQPGWEEHLTSGITQWITIFTIGSFILTFYIDFKRVSIYPPELKMHTDPVPNPVEAKNFRSFGFIYN